MNKDDLVKQWDDYVESMGSVMGEVEHMAQQMRDRIAELEAKLEKAERRVYNNAISEKISSTTDDLIAAHSLFERVEDLVVANGKLEAELEKAVGALQGVRLLMFEDSAKEAFELIDATLAELEG